MFIKPILDRPKSSQFNVPHWCNEQAEDRETNTVNAIIAGCGVMHNIIEQLLLVRFEIPVYDPIIMKIL